MKKLLSLLIITCLLVTCLSNYVYGEEINTISDYSIEKVVNLPKSIKNIKSVANEFSSISVKESVTINGVQNYLYPTFDNIEIALINIEKVAPEFMQLVNENTNLKELYDSDFETVISANISENIVSQFIFEGNETIKADSTITEQQLLEEQSKFDQFYDIYENKAKNEQIKQYLAENPNPDIKELSVLLPYDSPFVKEYESNPAVLRITTYAAQYFDRAKGIEYAIKHATNRNGYYGDYTVWGGDCTNFASQILVAGGINMHDTYPNEQTGWWTKLVHTPSRQWHSSVSWINANRFVKFMGTSGNVYSSFYTFSSKLQSGDHIAFDQSKDGDWDHLGFVTYTGTYNTYYYTNSSGTRISKYYRDFMVAQHTNDYHLWTSSDTNGWEKLDGTVNYAIVRRNAAA